jgi:hypothetical protein
VVPREDAVRLERAQEFDGVGHEPEKALLAVLLGQDHGHSEQAPDPGELLAEGAFAARPAARHRLIPVAEELPGSM